VLGFPVPYRDELLYSVIARAGVHYGETSPKQLLDSVFGNRKVIATVDLPSHIQCIVDQYPESLGLNTGELIARHTLWTIYAPFLPGDRRSVIEHWMEGRSQGAAHLASGIAASRIKTNQYLLICPQCVADQEDEYGEAYWDRRWQVPLICSCPVHGPLYQTSIQLNAEHRHAYIPVSEAKILQQLENTASDTRFANLVHDLFRNPFFKSPSYEQWTQFYQDFAVKFGYQVGRRIDHREILTQYCSFWGRDWLRDKNLLPSPIDTSWLKGIFRKHRKAFCFAEHLTVLAALSDADTGISSAIESALCYAGYLKKKRTIVDLTPDAEQPDQSRWLTLLEGRGPKQARQLEPALYARLYRNHYDWLMITNLECRAEKVPINSRVDWQKRDRGAARALLLLCRQLDGDLGLPRFTKTYLLKQLSNRATIEKNFYRLPRCRDVVEKYSESISEYQVRRLTRVVILLYKRGGAIKRWSLLRDAGLSDERMTDLAKKLLKEILKGGA
jgi:TniQ/Tn7-like transposition protein D